MRTVAAREAGRQRARANRPMAADGCRVAGVGAAVAAEAQTASSLDTLVQSGELTIGDGIYLTDVLGQLIKGDITDLSSSVLTVTRGRETWTLAVSEVKRIERQDSLVNGIMLGVAVGAIPSGFICLRFPRECLYAFLYTTPYMAIARRRRARRLKYTQGCSRRRDPRVAVSRCWRSSVRVYP